MSTMPFSEEAWDERYRSATRVWSGNPNPQLVAETGDLPPGRVLDVGCGEGADALWLAQHGWQVVGVDISSVALERAAARTVETDAHAAAHIEWRHADLLSARPDAEAYDLVSAQFMQLPPDLRTKMFAGLAAAVKPGGTLLVVGHHPSDMTSGMHRPKMPELFYAAEDIAALLGDGWTIQVAEARAREVRNAAGEAATVQDTVLRATRDA